MTNKEFFLSVLEEMENDSVQKGILLNIVETIYCDFISIIQNLDEHEISQIEDKFFFVAYHFHRYCEQGDITDWKFGYSDIERSEFLQKIKNYKTVVKENLINEIPNTLKDNYLQVSSNETTTKKRQKNSFIPKNNSKTTRDPLPKDVEDTNIGEYQSGNANTQPQDPLPTGIEDTNIGEYQSGNANTQPQDPLPIGIEDTNIGEYQSGNTNTQPQDPLPIGIEDTNIGEYQSGNANTQPQNPLPIGIEDTNIGEYQSGNANTQPQDPLPTGIEDTSLPEFSGISRNLEITEDEKRPIIYNTAVFPYKKIAKGGEGTIYEASQRGLNRKVALKIAHTNSNKLVIKKAQRQAKLNHTNIPPVFMVSNDSFVMELIEGTTLRTKLTTLIQEDSFRIKDKSSPLNDLITICQTIEHSHKKDILHLDLKPENIILKEHGQLQVIDWGLYEEIKHKWETQKEVSAMAFGSIKYAPPELFWCTSLNTLTKRTDVYLLGGILYEILTGKTPRPYIHQIYITKELIHVDLELTFPEIIKEELQKICRKALARDPKDRYAEVKDLRIAIENFMKSYDSLKISQVGCDLLKNLQQRIRHRVTLDINSDNYEKIDQFFQRDNSFRKNKKKKILVNKTEDKQQHPYEVLSEILHHFKSAEEIYNNNEQVRKNRPVVHVLYSLLAASNKDYITAQTQAEKAREYFTAKGSINKFIRRVKEQRKKQEKDRIRSRNLKYVLASSFFIATILLLIFVDERKKRFVDVNYEKDNTTFNAIDAFLNFYEAKENEITSFIQKNKSEIGRNKALLSQSVLLATQNKYDQASRELLKIKEEQTIEQIIEKIEGYKNKKAELEESISKIITVEQSLINGAKKDSLLWYFINLLVIFCLCIFWYKKVQHYEKWRKK